MIPAPTTEDLAVRESVRRFALAELAPRAAEFDESETFVGAHLPRLAETGILGLNLPQAWGGVGISPLGLVGAVEEIAAACPATASMVTAHYLATEVILLAGSDAQKECYLPGAAAGKLLGAFALTEPGAQDPIRPTWPPPTAGSCAWPARSISSATRVRPISL